MKLTIIPIGSGYESFLNLYPPVQANKLLPEWYKNKKFSNQFEHWKHSNGYDAEPITAKNCPAVQDIVSTGVILPIWSRFKFTTNKNEDGISQSWNFQAPYAVRDSEENHVSYHTPEQLEGMNLKTTVDGRLIKIFCPYKFIAPEGYNIMFTDPFYHYRDDIRCLPGIVEADKWGFVTIPFEILKDEFVIEAGEPLVHLYLVKRESKKIDLDVRVGTDAEYKKNRDELVYLQSSSKNYRTKKGNIYSE